MGRLEGRMRDVSVQLLALVTVVVVVVTAGGYLELRWLPRLPDGAIQIIPHVNVAISVAAVVTITYGWRSVRDGRISAHRRAMLLAGGLFAMFLVLYLYRLSILGGPTAFEGSDRVYRFVYRPLLGLHIGLAIVCIPVLFDVLALGLTVPQQTLAETRHPRFGRIAAVLWIASFSMGIGVYTLLYWF